MPDPGTVSLSSAAASVTVCGVSQFDVVNVSEVWLPAATLSVSAVMSASPDVVMLTVTEAAGALDRRTVCRYVSFSGTSR